MTILRKKKGATSATQIDSPYLTLLESAAYLRLSKESMYRLVTSKRLTGYKVAERWLFLKKDLDSLVTSKAPRHDSSIK